MRNLKLTTLALALAAALPAQAADPALDTKKELQALKDRIAELEKAKAPAGGGMTAEQQQDFNRIAVKTEAMEDARDDSGLKGLKISGYADVNYVYNVNKERGTFQFLVPSDQEAYGYDNSYFGSIALDIQKETDSGTKYRLTLIPKRGIGDFFGYGSIVHEATVNIPVSGDVKFFAGQIPDWQGYEYVQPTLNKLITHNLLFDFTLPYGYVGGGLEFPLGGLAMKAAIVNVNTAIRNVGESVPSLVFRGDYEVGEFLGFGFAGLVGNKANLRAFIDSGYGTDPDSGAALLADGLTPVSVKDTLAATIEADFWYTRGDLTLNGQLSYGQQEKAAITADPTTGTLRDSRWYGASALLAYKLTPRLEGILRADYISNKDNGGGLLDWVEADGSNGIGPGQTTDDLGNLIDDPEKGADKYAVTVGLSYSINENATFKAEYRYDGATQNVFQKNSDGSFVKSNSLISTGVVVFF
jgi:opacity protein-like surface antigen